MADITLPEKLQGVEVVRSVRTPASMEYKYTAGLATTRFLKGIAQGKILGERAPGGKVYVPSRGADPELGQPTTEQVELAHTGTLTSFCVVNVAFYGQGMEIPYTAGLILLDGADLSMMCLLQEVDVKDVRIGMRLEAVWADESEWAPNLESIKYFRPIDEPDVEVIQPGAGGDVVRDIAVIAYAQMPNVREETVRNEVEMLMPVIADVRAKAGLTQQDIGFTCSGSTDYLSGQAFSFVSTLDGVGPWPPIQESHVEMDGAFALYEAWVKLQLGDLDTALVYCYGKSAPGPIHEVLSRQLDPYHVAPLWPDAISLAALQARALIDAGKATEADFAEVATRSRRNALNNPCAQLQWDRSIEEHLSSPLIVDPLRKDDCPPITDGACAVILAADDKARELRERPAWIRGIDHRIEPMALGLRDLTTSVSTRTAGAKAGATGSFDVAELHAPFSSQELILRESLGLGDHGNVNPSGGALSANPVMVAGLTRIGEVAQRIMDGDATRGIAHATSGPCLQQNLVTVLEGEG